jgi:hypothetical protein
MKVAGYRPRETKQNGFSMIRLSAMYQHIHPNRVKVVYGITETENVIPTGCKPIYIYISK